MLRGGIVASENGEKSLRMSYKFRSSMRLAQLLSMFLRLND
jgi:hypothetical protein